MSILKDILQLAKAEVSGQLKHALDAQTKRIIRKAMRLLVLGIVGLTFLALGLVFILYGAATYLGLFMFSGLAYGLVGLIVALVGTVLVLLTRR